MLLEMINGNLKHRIPLNGADEQFDNLATALNKIACQMEENGYASPYADNNVIKSEGNNPSLVMIQNVQNYILNHLEEQLPSTKELSEMFGTNEFTLKESFRNILKTSIYQYYNDERLKKSRILIQETQIPLKQIAYMCGFSSYTTFYKAFRKKYQYTPSDLYRNYLDS